MKNHSRVGTAADSYMHAYVRFIHMDMTVASSSRFALSQCMVALFARFGSLALAFGRPDGVFLFPSSFAIDLQGVVDL